MGSRTISLEDSAYELLKSAKREGESFSDVIHRLLSGERPSLLDLEGLLAPAAAEEVADVVARLKSVDLEHQKRRRGS